MAASGLILGTMKDSSLNEQLSMFFIGDHGKKFEATDFGRLKTGRIETDYRSGDRVESAGNTG
jgi:hypothetical protein